MLTAANVLLPKYPGAVISEGQKVKLWALASSQVVPAALPARGGPAETWQHSVLWRKGWPEEIRRQQRHVHRSAGFNNCSHYWHVVLKTKANESPFTPGA